MSTRHEQVTVTIKRWASGLRNVSLTEAEIMQLANSVVTIYAKEAPMPEPEPTPAPAPEPVPSTEEEPQPEEEAVLHGHAHQKHTAPVKKPLPKRR